ncbi:condensation domain-containing protein [Saccharopolyspora dendranthemae]|uniref:Phosphopantetheine binding protein n=1 Tax=Saccharopolyspora dendranthemae TaxID=1181886 RepID=A0A561U7X6_9PSEU|nr:condensation domain-containing protein [Saccharopolyspora dendranthemae]TWF95480.1 phosphopantetheine binding protein [Saccharopolyspora dendranthemae]
MRDRSALGGDWPPRASFAQERAWFAARLTHDPPTYCVVDEFPVHADLAADDLVAALALLAARHESLRTGLRVVDGRLTRDVRAQVEPPVEHLDLSGFGHGDQGERIRALREAMARRPFDLERPPLWRAAVLELGEGAWSVLFAAHHAVYDTASSFNVRAELTEICAAEEEGRDPRLPDLPCTYGEHARRERARLTPARRAELAAHWRERLAGLPPVHAVPLDRPRPSTRTFRGAEVRAALPDDVRAALVDSARHHGTRPVVLLLAGYVALLHHVSGSDDIVLGLPVAGRAEAATLPMVGALVNMRVLRVDVGGDPGVTALVGRVAAAVEADESYDIPFQTLVELVAAPRPPGVPPLYQLAFNHDPGGVLGAPASSCEEDLLLDVTDEKVRVVYDVALFDRATAEALLSDYLRLLATALDAPDTRLSQLGPRRAVTGVGPSRPDPAAGGAPSTACERDVAGVWQDLLGTEVTDVHQDFFSLGGHSLQALKMLATLTAAYRAEVSLRTFFADPTVAGLAVALRREHRGGTA